VGKFKSSLALPPAPGRFSYFKEESYSPAHSQKGRGREKEFDDLGESYICSGSTFRESTVEGRLRTAD
jgi:hypothetical protein